MPYPFIFHLSPNYLKLVEKTFYRGIENGWQSSLSVSFFSLKSQKFACTPTMVVSFAAMKGMSGWSATVFRKGFFDSDRDRLTRSLKSIAKMPEMIRTEVL